MSPTPFDPTPFRRDTLLQPLRTVPEWDLLVIGGGATGLGVALEAVGRGYRTLLLEQTDFAKGTSSRSTKLVHGGVRYLAQGDVGLVREALHERGLLLQNAPHLVSNRSFVIPGYQWWARPFYTLGLKLYDVLAGRLSLGRSHAIGRAETLRRLPTLRPQGLRGGVLYHDGQFDDARLAVNLAQTIIEQGGTVLNHVAVTALRKNIQGRINGVQARDQETGQTYELAARVVVNATGVFVDAVRQLDEAGARPLVRPSQGVHVVLERHFLPGDTALMIPRTDDGRVLFAVPWHGRVVLGTTDTPLNETLLEPQALDAEIDFILRTAGRYLAQPPQRADIRSIFAGLRPLAAPTDGSAQTKEISRSHKILVSEAGLLTITGGKWTTYRRMGQDTVDRAAALGQLPARPSRTAHQPLHGAQPTTDFSSHLYVYGSDLPGLQQLLAERPELTAPLLPGLEFSQGEVVWVARYEMARTVEDVLARRVRLLFLDAAAALRAAPVVAALLAAELGHDAAWQRAQVAAFADTARHYLPPA